MPVKFYLHPKTNKHGKAPITVSINIRQTRLLTTLGFSVDPTAWNESGQVKPRYTNSKGIPARVINNRIYKIQIHFSEYETSQKARPTLDELKEELSTAISLGDDLKPTEAENSAPVKSIFDYLDEFVKEQSVLNQWAYATVQEASALAKTRDLFCFCAFTSLRYSDMASLKRTDIAEKTKANAMKLIDDAWGM